MGRRRLTVRSTVVVGEFDGMHLGHRALVGAASRLAGRARRPLVAVVLDDVCALERLSPVHDRLRSLLAMGCAAAVAVPADSSDVLDGPQRLADLIVEATNAAGAVLACPPTQFDHAWYPSIRSGLRRHGVEVVEVERQLDVEGTIIAGAPIRSALRRGDVVRSAAWLGHPYTLTGAVVHGAGLGRTIGFATANVEPPAGRVIPARGVYAGCVTLRDGTVRDAAVNIGHRPTVTGDGRLLIEAHLLDFDADIYGAEIEIAFTARLRDEHRFTGIDELVGQLARDVEAVRSRRTG